MPECTVLYNITNFRRVRMKYPNNHCGECPVWLAMWETDDFGYEYAVEKYCMKCPVYIKGLEEDKCQR
jgi:hypothetical protein